MKRKAYRKSLLGFGLALALLCAAAAPQALAAEAADPNYDYMTIYDQAENGDPVQDGADITDGDAAGTENGALADEVSSGEGETSSTVSEYNLASEDWNALLGVQETNSDGLTVEDESEPAMSGWLFGGNAKSDGGLSKVLIAAIIAFALGAIGVTFFIYSQFIYKAKLRRKAAEQNSAESFDGEEELLNGEELQKEPAAPAPAAEEPREQVIRPKAAPEAEKPAQPAAPHESALSEEDEEKLHQVDWDKFFDEK